MITQNMSLTRSINIFLKLSVALRSAWLVGWEDRIDVQNRGRSSCVPKQNHLCVEQGCFFRPPPSSSNSFQYAHMDLQSLRESGPLHTYLTQLRELQDEKAKKRAEQQVANKELSALLAVQVAEVSLCALVVRLVPSH
jgi:hypothetical protein